MSVVARPKLLLALSAVAACSGDAPADATDGGASPDAVPPRTMVMLGSRGQCPRELQIDGDRLYWLEGDVLVRSGTSSLSPEVVYTGVTGSGLRVAGGAAFWRDDWPVRLDLESRLARPLATTPVQGLEIVDGVRPVVLVEETRIAEIDGAGALRDLHTAATGQTLDMLARGGRWLVWRSTTFASPVFQWRDAVGGAFHSGPATPWHAAASSEHHALFVRRDEAGTKLRVIEDGADLGETGLPLDVSRVAVTDQGVLYAVHEPTRLLIVARSLRGAIELAETSTVTRVDEVVAVGDGAIAVSCEAGNATFYRWYP